MSDPDYQYLSSSQVGSLRDATWAQERVAHLEQTIVDGLVRDAYVAALNLRNVLGDGDGYAADQASTITDSLLALGHAIAKDPGSFVIATLRANPDRDAQREILDRVMAKLVDYRQSL